MIDSIPKTDSSGNSSELEFLVMGMRYKQGQGGISLDGSTPVLYR